MKRESISRICRACGREFRSISNLDCQKCSASDHECTNCGKIFNGHTLKCQSCRRMERECSECGRAFKGTTNRCNKCRSIKQECRKCSKEFTGLGRLCPQCGSIERVCVDCGKTFTGHTFKCSDCRKSDRICVKCNTSFQGHGYVCKRCTVVERTCPACGKTFESTNIYCPTCYYRNNPEISKRQQSIRRALKFNTAVFYIPREIYRQIQSSGPCVYCGEPAQTVDHITPLARGGYEIERNLVPACKPCNSSKRDRMLAEWDQARVRHALSVSWQVWAEYERQRAGDYDVPA
jgi:hypothetical protein